jgi:hypothetical protein
MSVKRLGVCLCVKGRDRRLMRACVCVCEREREGIGENLGGEKTL